jgi:hypothetical protein
MGWSGEPEGWEHGHMSRRTAELPSLVLKEDLGKNGKRKQKPTYVHGIWSHTELCFCRVFSKGKFGPELCGSHSH